MLRSRVLTTHIPHKPVALVLFESRCAEKLEARSIFRCGLIRSHQLRRPHIPCGTGDDVEHGAFDSPAEHTTAQNEITNGRTMTIARQARNTRQAGIAETIDDAKCPH